MNMKARVTQTQLRKCGNREKLILTSISPAISRKLSLQNFLCSELLPESIELLPMDFVGAVQSDGTVIYLSSDEEEITERMSTSSILDILSSSEDKLETLK